MQNCNIPTKEQCYKILKECHVPKHIIRHCEVAADLAVELAKKISVNGIEVNIDFVHRACLLHDILRVCDFHQILDDIFDEPITEEDRKKWQKLTAQHRGMRHEEAACEFLKSEYPEIALAIKKHAYRSLLDEQLTPKTIEEKLVYYADKRVMHDKVVSLKERLEEGHKRNIPVNCKKDIDTDYIDLLIFKMESELFAAAGILEG
ncbi:MAG: HD domain-containing protein [Sedimentisphaerales bacterium]|nr:HD domain-containing protein [Sedimentisphaerales bacterium]